MKKKASKKTAKEVSKKTKNYTTEEEDIPCWLDGHALKSLLHVGENVFNGPMLSYSLPSLFENYVISINGIKPNHQHVGHLLGNQGLIADSLDIMSPSHPIFHPDHPNYIGLRGSIYSKNVLESFSIANLMAQNCHNVNLLSEKVASWATSFPSEGYTNSQNVVGRMINETGLAVSKLGSYSGLHESFTGQLSEQTKFQDKFNALGSGFFDNFFTANLPYNSLRLSGFYSNLEEKKNQFTSVAPPLSAIAGLLITGKNEVLQTGFKDWEKLSTLPIGINNTYGQDLSYTAKNLAEVISRGTIIGHLGNISYGLAEKQFSKMNAVGDVYKKVNDVSASYASINTHLYNKLRWLPQENGGVWEAEYPTSKKSEDKQIEQLKADVVNLREEVKHLKLQIKKRDEGYAYLIESKLEIVEKRLQLALVASENKNLPTLLEHNTEDLIDKYGVMNMLKISESTYHRNKHIWTTYQIGSKKLYKASEIKAHIKQFLK